MAGCLQDRVEGRLSELHQALHTQVEEVHITVDECQLKETAIDEALAKVSSRAAQVGVVTCSCLATLRALDARVADLERLHHDIQRLAAQGEEIARHCRTRQPAPPSSGASVHFKKNDEETKDPSGHSEEARPAISDLWHSVDPQPSDISCLPEARVRETPPCPSGCHSGPRVRMFYRRAGPNSFERGSQTMVTVFASSQLTVSEVELTDAQLALAQTQYLASLTGHLHGVAHREAEQRLHPRDAHLGERGRHHNDGCRQRDEAGRRVEGAPADFDLSWIDELFGADEVRNGEPSSMIDSEVQQVATQAMLDTIVCEQGVAGPTRGPTASKDRHIDASPQATEVTEFQFVAELEQLAAATR